MMDLVSTTQLAAKTFGFLRAVRSFFIARFCKLWNCLRRPKLHFDLRQQRVVFETQDGTKNLFNYFCLIMYGKPNKKIKINSRKIQINNEPYQAILQKDNNFLGLDKWKECKNEVYNTFKVNWLDISQGNHSIIVDDDKKYSL